MFWNRGMSKESNEANETDRTPSTPTPEGATAEGATPAESVSLMTPEELALLREKADQVDGLKDRILRTVADLENFRKRAARERQEAVQYANQSLLEKLVPALDNLDMALSAVSSTQGTSMDSLKTGVEMVLVQLKSVLRDSGLEEIVAQGQPFDPTWHEAVSEQETTEVPEGHVLQQLRKGYRLQQRLLRPATVVVARQPKAS